MQVQGGRGAGPAGCTALAHPDLVSRTNFPRNSTSLPHSSEKGPPLSGAWHHMSPASRSVEPPCVAPGWDAADLSGLPPAVVEAITQARVPSTRQTYALKPFLSSSSVPRTVNPGGILHAPPCTKVSEFREGCNLLHDICLSRARLSTSACHKVVTGFSLWRFP